LTLVRSLWYHTPPMQRPFDWLESGKKGSMCSVSYVGGVVLLCAGVDGVAASGRAAGGAEGEAGAG
jgi:hypothetical protein